ncbi:protein Roco7 [Cryptosporidium xiaoi]|uniref:Protein Roco7 n=1 Tax=Cryptosporidium xiaoi TaxID=659607 RepID=A0AAV9XWP8_9CRYT
MSAEDGILKSSKSWSISTLTSGNRFRNNESLFNPIYKHDFLNSDSKEFGVKLNSPQLIDFEYQQRTHKIDKSQPFPKNVGLNVSNMFLKGNLARKYKNDMSNSVNKPVLRQSSSFCVSINNRVDTKTRIEYIHRPISPFNNNNIANKVAFSTNYNYQMSEYNNNKKLFEFSNKNNSFYIPIIKQVIGTRNIQTNDPKMKFSNSGLKENTESLNSNVNTVSFKSSCNNVKELQVLNKDKFSPKPLYNQENTMEFLNNRTLKRIMAVNVNSKSTGWNRMSNITNSVNKIFVPRYKEFEIISESGVSINDVEMKSILGFGSTSLVYLGTWRGTDVAIKIFGNHNNLNEIDKNYNILRFRDLIKPLEKNQKDSQRYNEFKCELNLLKEVRHPNIVQYMGGNTLENPPFLICEFCSGGTLFNLLHGSSKKCSNGRDYIFSGPKIELSIFQRLKILLDIARGIYFLHTSSPVIIHRDIKSLNIFLSTPVEKYSDIPIAKIGDFGLCKKLDSTGNHMNVCESLVGTYQWMAPEVIINQVYNEYIDIYSFGMTMYEVLSNKTPFIEMGVEVNPEFLANEIIKGARPSLNNIPNDVPSEIVNIMVSCWDQIPSNRGSMLSIIKTLGTYVEKYNRI